MEEEKRQSEISLGDLWSILKQCWWVMLIAIVIVAVAIYTFLNVTHRDEYTATVTIWAMRMPEGQNENKVSTSDVSIATYLINDYMLLIRSEEIMDRVITAQNLTLTPDELSRLVSVKNESSTRVMYLSVTTASPKSAQAIANTWGKIFCDHINATMGGEEMVELWAEAREPQKPSNPISMMRVLLIAFVAGIAVYGLYFIRFLLDDKVSTPDDVEKYLGINVLGSIPDKNSLRRRRNKDMYYYSYGDNYGQGHGSGKSQGA